jgi:hypothetical protein
MLKSIGFINLMINSRACCDYFYKLDVVKGLIFPLSTINLVCEFIISFYKTFNTFKNQIPKSFETCINKIIEIIKFKIKISNDF